MFRNIRKPLALLLAVTAVFMAVPAFAETVTVDMLFGTLEGNTYENAFLGMGCDLSGMHFYTDAEIETVNNLSKSLLSEDIAKLAEANITVMAAEMEEPKQNINIQVRNMKDYITAYNTIGIKTIAESSLNQFVAMLEAQGMSEVQLTVAEQDIGGEIFTCLDGQYQYMGLQMYFRQVWLLRDDYLVYITATSLGDNTKDELFARFFMLQ